MQKDKLRLIGSRLYWLLVEFGIDFLKMKDAFRGLPAFLRDRRAFRREASGAFSFPQALPRPCLMDRFAQSGTASGAYFHQDLYVARRIFEKNPERHVDVGSRVDGFVAHVASFRQIEVCDIRPLMASAANIRFLQADFMGELDACLLECCDSLSCLHALEHFGLGRYGDPVCKDGFLKGWDNLYRVLKPGGTLYFSVPLGPARVEFNAHRVFSVGQLKGLIDGRYEVVRFSYIDDAGGFFEDVDMDGADDNFGCQLGCAVLELGKK